jgi:hypothetical protein
MWSSDCCSLGYYNSDKLRGEYGLIIVKWSRGERDLRSAVIGQFH